MIVGDIQFRNLLSWQPDELRSRLRLKVGEPYDQLLEREDLTQLAQIMRRVNVIREPMPNNEVRIIFVVEEFPRLRQVQKIGNRSITDERIDLIVGLQPGDVIDNRAVESIRRRLLQEYNSMGLTNAKVDVNVSVVLPREQAPDAPPDFAQADLQIVVDEGERIKIDDLIIEGNEAFSTVRLKLLLESKGSFWFLKNYYDNQAFENDLVKLRNFYTANGYFDVLVERGNFVERAGNGGLIITPVIKIQEGEKYFLRSVDVRGARLFSRDEVLRPFDLLLGKEFSARTFGRALEEVQNLYLDNGFLTTEIKPIYDYSGEDNALDVTLEVTEKNRIYVGDVRLNRPKYEDDEEAGLFSRFYSSIAPSISNEAIIREVLLEPGEVYSKKQERETVRQLRRLGVFSKVEATNVPTSNERVHDLYLAIEEAVTGEFSAGVGFGDVSGGFFYVSLNERNLFGQARDLRFVAQIGTNASNAVLSYTDRHFRDTNDMLTASLFYNRFRRPAWIEDTFGTHWEITRPLYGEWDGALRGRLEYVSLDERRGRDPKEDLDVSYPVVTARLRFSQDTRYPFEFPVEGRELTGGVEAGWADGPLLKFTGGAHYLYQLGPGFVYHFAPSFGLMPYDSDTVGITERFFLGGSEDLRGFEIQGAGRRDEDDDDVPIGGAVKLLVRNELTFPLYDPVSGVFFIDAGTLGEHPFDYEVPRVSTGLGLRLAMPVGNTRTNVAVDFALPLIKQDGDQTEFIHFSFRSFF